MTSVITSGRHLTPLQERFIESGFKGFGDQEIIELVLSLTLPRRQCQRRAKECIEHFKSLRGFLMASPQELERAGITASCMLCIKLLHELPEEVLKQKIIEKPVYESSKEIFDYLNYSMRDLEKEIFKIIHLSSRNQIIEVKTLFEGTANFISVSPRQIVESAMGQNAAALIFVHNHPSGDPTPSKSDKQLTRDLVFVGNILQIKVLDHIIIGGDKYFSFADEGFLQKYEDNFLHVKLKSVSDKGIIYKNARGCSRLSQTYPDR